MLGSWALNLECNGLLLLGKDDLPVVRHDVMPYPVGKIRENLSGVVNEHGRAFLKSFLLI